MTATTPQPRSYQDRLLAGLCVEKGCATPPEDGCDRCALHAAAKRARDAAWQKQRRATRRRRRQCQDCGAPTRRSRCQRCRVVVGQAPKRGVGARVDASERTRTHADGRTRYHGQLRRGRQSNADLSAQDIAAAQKELTRALEGLAYWARHPEVAAMGRIQRAEIERAWLSKVDLARRRIEEVLERHRYARELAKAAPGPRESED